MRALVTGATGMIGPALVNQLLAENWTRQNYWPAVHLIRRFLRSAVERFNGDIVDLDSLRPAMDGVDVVFHLAAKLHLNNPSPNQSEEYRRINVDGAMNVARAALDAGVKRMVHFSTISVYGPSFGSTPYTESSTLNPQSLYAETKMQSEEGIRKIFMGSSHSSVVCTASCRCLRPAAAGQLSNPCKGHPPWTIFAGRRRPKSSHHDLHRRSCAGRHSGSRTSQRGRRHFQCHRWPNPHPERGRYSHCPCFGQDGRRACACPAARCKQWQAWPIDSPKHSSCQPPNCVFWWIRSWKMLRLGATCYAAS